MGTTTTQSTMQATLHVALGRRVADTAVIADNEYGGVNVALESGDEFRIVPHGPTWSGFVVHVAGGGGMGSATFNAELTPRQVADLACAFAEGVLA